MEAAYLAASQSPVKKESADDTKVVKKYKRKAATSTDEPRPKVLNFKPERKTNAPDADSANVWKSKIGYDRYIYFVREGSDVRVLMGLALDKPGISTLTNKTIDLNVHMFLRLYGLFLSGNAECAERKNSNKESGSLAPLFHLSGDVYFSWSRFQSSDLATVRRFVERGKANDLYPTASGFSFTEKTFNNIIELFKTMEPLKALASMLHENQPNEDVTIFVEDHSGEAATTLRTAIAQWVYMFISEKRKKECNLCIKHNKAGGDQYKNLKENGHSCVNTVGGTDGNGPITTAEWKVAIEKMLEGQVVQAYLLSEELASPKQIVTLDVARFLAMRRQSFDSLINVFLRDSVYFNETIFRMTA